MRRFHLVGLVLWRGGLLLLAGYALLEIVRWILRFYEVDPLVEIGLGLTLVGFLFVLVSLIMERLQDARAEGSLAGPGERYDQREGGVE